MNHLSATERQFCGIFPEHYYGERGFQKKVGFRVKCEFDSQKEVTDLQAHTPASLDFSFILDDDPHYDQEVRCVQVEGAPHFERMESAKYALQARIDSIEKIEYSMLTSAREVELFIHLRYPLECCKDLGSRIWP